MRSVTMDELLETPEAYMGPLIRVRGYAYLVFEKMALIEPVLRREIVRLDIRDLHAKQDSEIDNCRLQLVDVEGYLIRMPARGGDTVFLVAQSMVSSKRR